MNTFTIRRRGIAATQADMDAALERLRALDRDAERTRWIRSYVLREADGRFGTRCVFQAADAAALREHAALAGMPAEEILPVADTVLIRPDAPVNVYQIRRPHHWACGEDLQATAAVSRRVGDTEMADKVSWLRSYVVHEADGTLGTVCIYQGVDAQAIREHAARVGMPAEDIAPVVACVVQRADPVAQPAATQAATA